MVYIRAENITERLTYILNLIVNDILGLSYQIVNITEELDPHLHCVIDYSSSPLERAVIVPNAGLLEETNIKAQKFEIKQDNIPYLFYTPTFLLNQLDFDVFSASFFWVTEYEKWHQPVFDLHDRYDESQYLTYTTQGYLYPVVHHYAMCLWEKLVIQYTFLKRKSATYRYRLTFDIDHPWKYLFKPLYVQYGGMIKDTLQGRWQELGERITSLRTGKDPHDVFKEIFRLCPIENTLFFGLIDRHSSYDGRFTFRHRPYQTLIRQIVAKGYEIGIHPSYTTFMNRDRIAYEAEQLSQLAGVAVRSSRQHFLRYRLPDTYRALQNAGIIHDYTQCNYLTGGFRTGMAQPYLWFDLEENKCTTLVLHPTILMDVSMRGYLQLTPDAAVAYAQQLIEAVHTVNGEFTLLLHNDSLSESGMWKGWKSTMLDIIERVKWN